MYNALMELGKYFDICGSNTSNGIIFYIGNLNERKLCINIHSIVGNICHHLLAFIGTDPFTLNYHEQSHRVAMGRNYNV